MEQPEAVLITGVFGFGKSSAAEEMAEILEKRGAAYAVLDLDWLAWLGPEDEVTHQRVLLQNLRAVVENYRAAGVQLFVLAFAVGDEAQLKRIKSAMHMPVKVVRLTVSLPEIRRRLSSDVTTGRQDDLREAAEWIAAGKCEGGNDHAQRPADPRGGVGHSRLARMDMISARRRERPCRDLAIHSCSERHALL